MKASRSYQSFQENHRRNEYRFFPTDPRLRILSFVLLILTAFLVRSLWGMLWVLSYIVLLHLLSGASAIDVCRRSRVILLFALLAVALNAVLVEGEPLIAVSDRAAISREGLSRGLFYAMQIFVLYLSTILFVTLTPQEDFAQGLSALVKPISPRLAKRMALYALLSIGFLPLFFEEFERIATLQKFRGGGLEGSLVRKVKGVRLLLVPLLLSAIHRSGQLATVVELRGLKDSVGDLLYSERPPMRDYLFVMLTLSILAFAILGFSNA